VFLSFDLLAFLFWLFISSFVPGAILSFSVFKKDDFLFIEKLLIGFALGLFLLPMIPFLLYFIAGVTFSYDIALLSVGLLYAISIAAFVINKGYEITIPKEFEKKKLMIAIALLAILIASYMVRIGSYSPIFQELDPYYYTDTAQQLLVFGENPMDDQTSWYPEVVVNHRIIPAISYLEAIWYSLYNGSTDYNNMLLAVIAGMYPPVAAMLAVFFIYLLVSTATKREWGIAAAGIASFMPVFVHKLSAGEMEVQPYAFFALFFLYAFYALSLKRKDLRFSVLAGMAFAAVALGSSSQILAVASLLVFMVLQAVAYFFRKKDTEDLRFLLISNSIVFAIGPLLGSALLKDLFTIGYPSLTIVTPFLAGVLAIGALYLIKLKVPARQATAVFAAMIVIGLLVYALTPVGDYVQRIGKSGFALGEFTNPLDRTIAEQHPVSDNAVFAGQMGFVAATWPAVVSILLWPVMAAFDAINLSENIIEAVAIIGQLVALILLPISIIVNIVFRLVVEVLNLFLGTSVEYLDKGNSIMLFWVLAFWAALAYSLYSFVKKEEDNLFILIFAIIMPPFIVGIIKAKYTIYSAVLLAVAIGFFIGVASDALGKIKQAATALLAIAAFLVFMQFIYNAYAISLLWGSVQPLYQNDPAALQPKFQEFCTIIGDPDVCAAAQDPFGYADKGTNYQYNQKLCLFSVYSDYSHLSGSGPFWETHTAYYRCQRLSTYWVDSMEWINGNTEEGSRIISWWDYGHWINFFGQKNAVIRNEHISHEMIGAVADGYLDATPEELKEYMQAHDSEYALLDIELVAGGGGLGGKYGALNYLSCAWNNETNVSQEVSTSQCESDHLWETIYISQTPCTISSLTGKEGVTAYKVYRRYSQYGGYHYTPTYPGECVSPQNQNLAAYCQGAIKVEPAYCVGPAMLATGQNTTATYYLNETYENGDLKINKGLLQFPAFVPTTYHLGPVTSATILYTPDPIWLENGVIRSGYEDRKGKFYDSNLYHGIFLNSIPGFDLVYSTPDGAVKIYKIRE